MIMANSLLYAASRGHIHITSPTDVYAPPDFDAGFLSNPADVPPFMWAYQKTHEVIRRMPSFIEEVAGPAVSLASDALSAQPDLPGEIKDRVHNPASVEKFVRERVHTTYHPWCSCGITSLILVALAL